MLASAAPGAVADPAVAPTMTAAGGTQEGALSYVYKGTHHADDSCSAGRRDGLGRDRVPVNHDGGALRWRIPDARRPAVTLGKTPLLLPARLEYPPEPVRVSLAPVRSRGKVIAWTATSEPVGAGALRLVLTLRWTGPCSDGDEARWFYTVRSVPGRP